VQRQLEMLRCNAFKVQQANMFEHLNIVFSKFSETFIPSVNKFLNANHADAKKTTLAAV